MPLPLIAPSEVPQQRTCASYTVTRLGMYPAMEMRFVETVNEVLRFEVASATLDENSLYTQLVLSPVGFPESVISELVGRVLNTGSDVVFGTCQSVDGTTVVLETGVATDPTGITVYCVRINGFGEMVAREALRGQASARRLSTADSAQFQRMSQILGTVAFSLAKEVITRLGLTASDGDIAGALNAMAGDGLNLDSYIVENLETLETDISAGTFTNFTLIP